MAYTERIFENMPLYARMADEASTLEHVCDSIQPQMDAVRRKLDQLPFLFDPSTAPSSYLDWMGQWFGLAPIDGKWLGLGLNPKWSESHKREVLSRIWQFWQAKGTEWSVREAAALWLELPNAHNRVILYQPIGKAPTAEPPGFWTYRTRYRSQLTTDIFSKKRLGAETFGPYQPDWQDFSTPWTWDHRAVFGEELIDETPPIIPVASSRMGPRNLWQLYELTPDEWRTVFPNVFDLQPEILDPRVTPTIFGKLTQSTGIELEESAEATSSRIERRIKVDGLKYGQMFPYPAKESKQVTETTEAITYGNWTGFSYMSRFGAYCSKVNRQINTETKVIKGSRGFSYSSQFAGKFTEKQVSHGPGNFSKSASYFSKFSAAQPFYFAPQKIETTVETTVDGLSKFLRGGVQPRGQSFYYPAAILENTEIVEGVTEWGLPAEILYSPARTWQVKKIVEKTIPAQYSKGVPVKFQVGTNQVLKYGRNCTSSRQLFEKIPGVPAPYTETEIKQAGAWPAFGYSNLFVSFGGSLSPIDTFTIETLSMDDSLTIEVPTERQEDQILIHSNYSGTSLSKRDLFYYPPVVEKRHIPASPPDYRFRNPIAVATHFHRFDLSKPFNRAATCEVYPEIIDVPVTKSGYLTNTVDLFTTRRILSITDVQIDIDPEKYP
ncbi:MAG TPA: phage tail protein, partial [Leptolyngbyaceae cyanobacterium]